MCQLNGLNGRICDVNKLRGNLFLQDLSIRLLVLCRMCTTTEQWHFPLIFFPIKLLLQIVPGRHSDWTCDRARAFSFLISFMLGSCGSEGAWPAPRLGNGIFL